MERLTKLSMLGLLFGLVTVFAVGTLMTSAGIANAGGPGNKGFGKLEEPNGPASWLPGNSARWMLRPTPSSAARSRHLSMPLAEV